MRILVVELDGQERIPIGAASDQTSLANLISFSKRAAALGALPDAIILKREVQTGQCERERD